VSDANGANLRIFFSPKRAIEYSLGCCERSEQTPGEDPATLASQQRHNRAIAAVLFARRNELSNVRVVLEVFAHTVS
jgi:hypothetical protein